MVSLEKTSLTARARSRQKGGQGKDCGSQRCLCVTSPLDSELLEGKGWAFIFVSPVGSEDIKRGSQASQTGVRVSLGGGYQKR